VQKVGYSTLSVSLPSEWVKDIGLKQGDLITFTPERDGSLRLMPGPPVEREVKAEDIVVNSDLCDEPRMLERVIVGNYVLGCDTLRVVSSKRIRSEHVEEVRRISRRLIGLSIIEETPNQIVLQCSIDPAKFQIDMLMRRLSIIVSTMHNESMQALVNFDMNLAEDTIRREEEADMIYWLALRLLLSAHRVQVVAEKIGLKEPSQVPGNRLILKNLETIADCAEDIAKRIILLRKLKISVGKEATERLSQLGGLAHATFEKAMECLFTGDIKIANSILEMKEAVDEEEERLITELSASPLSAGPHLRHITSCLTRIAESGADIAAIAINRALAKPSDLCKRIAY